MSQGKAPATEVQKKTEPARQVEQQATRQPERGTVQQVVPQAAYRRVQVSRNGLGPADLLALQRAVGNRLVQRIVEGCVDYMVDQRPSMNAIENLGIVEQTKLTLQRAIFGPSLTEREKIANALRTRDPGDVKKISGINLATEKDKIELIKILVYQGGTEPQGWVGPLDESKIEEIWRSFGDQVSRVMAAHTTLWHHCISAGAELYKLPVVKKLQQSFVSDVKDIASNYLLNNRKVVLDEMERLGISPAELVEAPLLATGQADKIQKMQNAAATVAKLQRAQEEARKLVVGYDLVSIPMGHRQYISWDPVRFNPYVAPQSKIVPETYFLGPQRSVPLSIDASYDQVKEKYDKATMLIDNYITHYPLLYAVSREGKSATTVEFASIVSPEKAREQLGKALRRLIKDIEEAQWKLGKDLDPRDLTPIHDQLYAGKKSSSGIGWNDPLPNWVARDLVKDHEFAKALKTLGLQTAATALFLLAALASGGSLYVALAGLIVQGYQTYSSAQQYETLAQAARTSVLPGTELVTPLQVEEAKMQVEADLVALALATLAVGAQAAGELVGAIKGPTKPFLAGATKQPSTPIEPVTSPKKQVAPPKKSVTPKEPVTPTKAKTPGETAEPAQMLAAPRSPEQMRRYGGYVKRQEAKGKTPLSFEKWYDKIGKKPPPNPHGKGGDPAHKAAVAKLRQKADNEFPNDIIHEGESIKDITGINRQPDVWVEDALTGAVKKVYEAAKTKRNGEFVTRELEKKVQYDKAGIPNEFGDAGTVKKGGK